MNELIIMVRKKWQKLNNKDKHLENYWFVRNQLWFGIIEQMKKERPRIKIVLHHININDQNYELWWPTIPMFIDDHIKFHAGDKETNIKRSNSNKGKKFPGRNNHTKEGDLKISKKLKGKKFSKEHLENLSKSRKIAFLGEKNPMYGKKHREESLKKMSLNNSSLNKHWFTDGITTILTYKCPQGFKPGRTYKGE